MKVTQVKLTYIKPQPERNNKQKAWAKITLDHQLVISSIQVIDTEEKRYIVLPERKLDKNVTGGEFVTIPLVAPIVTELREHITDSIFDFYDNDPFNPRNRDVNEPLIV